MIGGVILFFKIMEKATKVDDEQDTSNTSDNICKKCGQELSLNDTKNYKGEDVKRYYCLRCWTAPPPRRKIDF